MAYVAPNLVYSQVAFCKRQTDPITEAVPANSDALILVNEVNPVALDAKRITVNPIRGSMTKRPDIMGRKLYKFNPQIYLQGMGGANGLEPFWLKLLEASGHSTTSGGAGGSSSWILVPTNTPVALTTHWYSASLRQRLIGCMFSAKLDMQAGGAPLFTFTGQGTYTDPTTTAQPTPTYPGFYARQCENESFSLSGYAAPRVKQITFDSGSSIQEREDLNQSDGLYGLYLADRTPVLDCIWELEPDLTTVDLYSILKNATTQAIQFTHGSAAAAVGSTFKFYAATAQLVELTRQETNKRIMISAKFNLQSSTDNGEYTLTASEKI